MKKFLALLLALLLVLSMVGCAGSGSKDDKADDTAKTDDAATDNNAASDSQDDKTDGKKLSVVHCLMHNINYFMQLQAQGGQAAADEYGADYTYYSPNTYPDANGQVDNIESAIAMGADLIIIDAVDNVVAGQAAQPAIDQGIAVTCSNSGIPEGQGLGLFSTDNYAAAETAADEMAKAIGNKGQVAVICYGQGMSSAEDRLYGFLDKMESDYPDIEVVDYQWINASTDEGADTFKTFVSAYPELDGVYSTCQDITQGVVTGVQELNKVGEYTLIGFDSGKIVNDAIRNGILTGSIMQSPYNMGYQACKAGLEYLTNGTKPDQWFNDTGVLFVTADNIESTEASQVMYD